MHLVVVVRIRPWNVFSLSQTSGWLISVWIGVRSAELLSRLKFSWRNFRLISGWTYSVEVWTGTINTRGWESGDFRRKSLFISETVPDKPMALGYGLNSIIFGDLEWPLIRVSKSLYTYKSNISNRCILGTKLLKNTNRKPYTIYPMVPLSMTLSDLWPQFQGHDIFWSRISEKTARLKDTVTIAQEETMPNIWNGTMFGDLDWPLNASRGFVSNHQLSF